jgi:hypothetical protein
LTYARFKTLGNQGSSPQPQETAMQYEAHIGHVTTTSRRWQQWHQVLVSKLKVQVQNLVSTGFGMDIRS